MKSYLKGLIHISEKRIPLVSDKLSFSDLMGAVMVRWGINRGKYRVDPGLYAIGSPDSSSDVFVTANYKLTFDTVRKYLSGINGWILVLDTKGVNVWCAAGKKTFGTDELIKRINETDLKSLISHRRLIVPQLGATGVSAHKVREATSFNVHYGPVRAADIKEFIKAGYRASQSMRRIKFGLYERLKLVPNDLIQGRPYLLIAAAAAIILSGISFKGGNFDFQVRSSVFGVINVVLSYLTGVVLAPALLPYLPFRMFSLKGLSAAVPVAVGLYFTPLTGISFISKAAWLLIIPSIASFMAMNFTGSSTFTSLSGVKREMKISLPLQITLAGSGIILLVISWF